MANFQFKQFEVLQDKCAMKVGTDGVLLGAWAEGANAKKILDIGTGTGLIALMMAQRFPEAVIDAIEVDLEAYEQALLNIANSKFRNNIRVFHTSLQEWMKYSGIQYDVLICNPPYFHKGFRVEDVKRKKARDAQYLPAEELIRAFQKMLAPGGSMDIILPFHEGEKFIAQCLAENINLRRKTKVYSKQGRPVKRLLLEFMHSVSTCDDSEIVIESEGRHNYTPAYKNLTKEFYLKF